MNTRNGTIKLRILTACILLMFSTFVFAHGNQQHVMGTITRIDATSITVKTTNGDVKTVMIMPDTKFLKGASPTTQQDLKVGDRVVIHAKPEGDMLQATEVKIGTAMKGGPYQH